MSPVNPVAPFWITLCPVLTNQRTLNPSRKSAIVKDHDNSPGGSFIAERLVSISTIQHVTRLRGQMEGKVKK